MTSPPNAVPDEVQAAPSGMMEQLSVRAPADAERERQYDVLAGMLATATAQGEPAVSEYLAGGGGAEEFDDNDEDARFALHCAAPQSPRHKHCEAEASVEADAVAAAAAEAARARWGDDSEDSEDSEDDSVPPTPPAPPAMDALGSEPAAGAEAEIEAGIALGMKIALGMAEITQHQAPPAAEVTDEEAANAAWAAEAEAEWAADVEEHARRREEAEAKGEAARVRKRAEAATIRARLEDELADVPAGMLNCVLKTHALLQ